MKKYVYLLLLFVFVIKAHSIPVDTDTSYPKIAVIDTADFYKVTINDLEGDSLFDIAYAWGVKPHMYAYVSVAQDDTLNLQFSPKEAWRWDYFQRRVVERWDQATYNKHPMHFYFVKNPFIINYNKNQLNNELNLMVWSAVKFRGEYMDSISNPYIKVCIDGGNYFTTEVGFSSIGNGSKDISSTYLGGFDDSSTGRKNDTTYENIDYVALHELCHPFIYTEYLLPYTDIYAHYRHLNADESPNSQAGEYEVYDPLAQFIWNVNGNHFCAPLSQMAMGTRSKYEDVGITLYGGYESNHIFQEQWELTQDSVSCKYLYEISDEQMTDCWNLHINSPKTLLLDTVRSILIPKSEQQNRSLLVYASDSLHPGYFKCFSLGAYSEATILDNLTGINERKSTKIRRRTLDYVDISPNPFRDVTVISYFKQPDTKLEILDLSGSIVKNFIVNSNSASWNGTNGNGNKVNPGVYILKLNQNGNIFTTTIILLP